VDYVNFKKNSTKFLCAPPHNWTSAGVHPVLAFAGAGLTAKFTEHSCAAETLIRNIPASIRPNYPTFLTKPDFGKISDTARIFCNLQHTPHSPQNKTLNL
jgi:hypothetical protein